MNQKLIDYEKVLKVIESCKNSRHNNVAYNLCWYFQAKYKDDVYSDALFNACDENLTKIL